MVRRFGILIWGKFPNQSRFQPHHSRLPSGKPDAVALASGRFSKPLEAYKRIYAGEDMVDLQEINAPAQLVAPWGGGWQS